jgi:hypothetical protein
MHFPWLTARAIHFFECINAGSNLSKCLSHSLKAAYRHAVQYQLTHGTAQFSKVLSAKILLVNLKEIQNADLFWIYYGWCAAPHAFIFMYYE